MPRFRIDTPPVWRGWSLGARSMAGGFVRQQSRWEDANREFFDRTQDAVHVDSGALKASGRHEVHLEGGRVAASVTYGGGDVDYAEYELDRGGSHDYLGIGWEAAQPGFERVFGEAWNRVVASW